jgi:hypothetical protein
MQESKPLHLPVFKCVKLYPNEKPRIRHNYFGFGPKQNCMATHISPKTGILSSQKELREKLINCALVCEECETACLNEDNITLLARCIELTRDCSDICLQAARLLQRQSEIAEDYLLVCEKICRLCMEECRKHTMEHCRTCADECEACADACHAAA